ncbi:MAG TPA: tetratricopeptide repeat protein, partial [Flavobacteriales bacterium]|nr:tetratricopeptide repeat protein [Flavobacteriales bacterium]
MMLKRLLLVLLPLCGSVFAQSTEQFIVWGDNAMRLGDHYGASRFYKEAMAQDPGPMELQWKYAEACRLSNQYSEAATYYEKVQRKDVGGRRHPEALRWLGEMHLSNGDYEAAKKTWQKVKQHAKDSTSFNGQRARNALAGIAQAKEWMQKPEEVIIEHIAMPVNTFDSEFAARMGPDSALYFASLRGDINDEGEVLDTAHYRIALYRAAAKGAAFDAPVRIEDQVLQRVNPAWSTDG